MKIKRIDGTLSGARRGWDLDLSLFSLVCVDEALAVTGGRWYLSVSKRDTIEKIRRYSICPNTPPLFWMFGYGVYFYRWNKKS